MSGDLILLLLGLKNGHVADLREDLLKSPTGRQVVFWSGQQGELMTPVVVRSYEKEIPGVEIVIPEIQRLVSLTATHDQGNEHYVDNVTLYSTRPGDPILAQYGGDVLRKDGDGIVLMSSVSEALDVQPGDAVEVTVERERDGAVETASVSLEVRAVNWRLPITKIRFAVPRGVQRACRRCHNLVHRRLFS